MSITYYIDLPSFNSHDTDYRMPSSVLAKIAEQAKASPLLMRFTNIGMMLFTEGEIGPGMVVPVIAPDRKTRKPKVYPMKWGVDHSSQYKSFLDVHELGNQIENRHCIIPCSWLIVNGKIVHSAGSHETWAAGIYQIVGNYPVFTLLTKKGYPVAVQADDIPEWLGGEIKIPAWLKGGKFVREFMVEGDVGLAKRRL